MRILMLLYTTFENDARVDRCAKTLAADGHEVLLLGKHRPGLPVRESVNGYTIYRTQWDGRSDTSFEAYQRDLKDIYPLRASLLSMLGPLGRVCGRFLFATSPLWQRLFDPRRRFKDTILWLRKWKPMLFRALVFPVIPLVLLYIARLLHRNSAEHVENLARAAAEFRERLLSDGEEVNEEDIDEGVFERRKRGYYNYAETVLSFCEEFQPDFIHAHDFNTLIAASEAYDKLGVPFAYDTHELWVHRNRADRYFPRLEREWEERVEKRIMRNAAFSITVCDSIADYLAERYDVERPIVVRNTPERKTNQRRADRSLRKALGFSEDDFVCIYVGRITFYRGVLDILRALPHMRKEIKFVTLGYFDRRFEKIFRETVSELHIQDRVFSFGPVSTDEVADWIKEVDISLTTMSRSCLSYVFTLPNKLFESLQANVPILGPDSPEICRIVEKYNCGLTYVDGDHEDLATKVNALVDDRERLMAMRSQSVVASKDLCWDNERLQLLAPYRDFSQALIRKKAA